MKLHKREIIKVSREVHNAVNPAGNFEEFLIEVADAARRPNMDGLTEEFVFNSRRGLKVYSNNLGNVGIDANVAHALWRYSETVGRGNWFRS